MPYSTPITRTYIDTRLHPNSSTPNTTPLPLLDTLPIETQTAITRFLRPPDRFMSLSSALLKHYFIHKTAKLPWSAISVSRTPKPHARPHWSPPPSWNGTGGLEFNVTHQAGMTCLIGCRTPASNSVGEADLAPLDLASLSAIPTQGGFDDPPPRLGVDIACTNERGRTPRDVSNPTELAAWIDVFAEMFSARERSEMKAAPITGSGDEIAAKLRRFYTSWALKEAFIKLVGEGLLASWLREVEFLDVHSPAPSNINTWTSPTSDFRILLQGTQLYADDVKMDVIAFEDHFIVATATRGVVDEGDGRWLSLDIERDIRPCAEGRCQCLE